MKRCPTYMGLYPDNDSFPCLLLPWQLFERIRYETEVPTNVIADLHSQIFLITKVWTCLQSLRIAHWVRLFIHQSHHFIFIMGWIVSLYYDQLCRMVHQRLRSSKRKLDISEDQFTVTTLYKELNAEMEQLQGSSGSGVFERMKWKLVGSAYGVQRYGYAAPVPVDRISGLPSHPAKSGFGRMASTLTGSAARRPRLN